MINVSFTVSLLGSFYAPVRAQTGFSEARNEELLFNISEKLDFFDLAPSALFQLELFQAD